MKIVRTGLRSTRTGENENSKYQCLSNVSVDYRLGYVWLPVSRQFRMERAQIEDDGLTVSLSNEIRLNRPKWERDQSEKKEKKCPERPIIFIFL